MPSDKADNSMRKIALSPETMELLKQEHDKHPGNPYLFPVAVSGSAGFTLATYTHATNKVQERAAAKMGNMLKQAL